MMNNNKVKILCGKTNNYNAVKAGTLIDNIAIIKLTIFCLSLVLISS
jgi:hypothetical protein